MLFRAQPFPTPRRKTRSTTTRSGFTLLEVLAVTGILLVLAALLFPAGQSFIEKSSQSRCTANLRQLYLAVRLYAQENDDRIIYSRGQRTGGTSPDWAPELAINGYLGTEIPQGTITNLEQVARHPVFRCPTAMANRRDDPAAARQYTYGFNAILSDAESTNGTKTFTRLSRPSHTLLISEGSGTTGWYLNLAKLPNPEHRDLSNVLFADGHVELRDPRKFPARSTPAGRIFWDGIES